MKKHEADAIVRFLGSCETLLSNHEMVVLCDGLKNANNYDHSDSASAMWWNAAAHSDMARSREWEELNEQRY